MRRAFVLLTAIRLACAVDSSVSGLFPPDTKAVIGIRLQALRQAGLFQGIETEIRKSATSLFDKGPLAGFDPLKDLDEVVIASSGKGENAPAIVVLRGRFPFDRRGPEAPRYRDVPILDTPQKKGGMLALIDATTAIGGDAEQVRAVIDRRGQGSGTSLPLARIEALRSKCAIWGFGEGLESAPKRGVKPGDLSSIDRFEFGVAFDRGLRLAAEIHLRTPEDAEKITSTLRLAEAMMQPQNQKKPVKNTGFNLHAENGTLKISLVLPESELKKAMQEERGSLVTALSSGLPAFMPYEKTKAAGAAAPAAPPVVHSEGKIVSNAEGDTVFVTLPGPAPAKP